MDWNALQHKLFAMDPADPAEDIRKMTQMANQPVPEVKPETPHLSESVTNIPEGTMPVDKDYSINDFAKLAGVQLNEVSAADAFKAGFKNYNKLDALSSTLDGAKPDAKVTAKPKPGKPAPKPKAGKPAPKPTGWPTSAEGHTLAKGDLVTYKNAKGQLRKDIPVVDLIQGKLDGDGKPQIQLSLKGATYAISRKQIAAVNGKKFTIVDAKVGTGKIEALEARIAYLESVIESLVEGKKEAKLIKARDPNAQYMNDLRKSGAAGGHKDKTKTIPRKQKHKDTNESIKSQLWAALNSKKQLTTP